MELSDTNERIISFFFYRIDFIFEEFVNYIVNKIIYKLLTAFIAQ